MGSPWGKDQHGPSGDQSWLGGTDRSTAGGGGTDAGQGSGWSSGFSSESRSPGAQPDTGFSGHGDQSTSGALPVRGPQFGRVDEANARASSDSGGWMSEFTGDSRGQSGGGTQNSTTWRQLLPGLVAMVFIAVIALTIGSRSGSNMGFFLLVAILPILMRVIRAFTGGNRRR